jgi:hypothetical protein
LIYCQKSIKGFHLKWKHVVAFEILDTYVQSSSPL